MSFRYKAEDFSHFHLTGWNPFQSDIVAAVERLKLTPDIHETGGAKTAEKALRERVEERVQIAWVEDYSVLAVAAVDDEHHQGLRPPTDERSRRPSWPSNAGRIRKQKHRLLAIEPGEPDLPQRGPRGPDRIARRPRQPA